jgi:hypothetical protein
MVVLPAADLVQIENMSLRVLQERIHEWAISKQWRGPDAETQRTTGDDIALICSEAAEALEAFREVGDPTRIWWTYDVEVDGVKFKHCSIEQLRIIWNCDDDQEVWDMINELKLTPKPQGVGVELADVMVRILDYCAEHGIDFHNMMEMVLVHNDTREIRHGGKHL